MPIVLRRPAGRPRRSVQHRRAQHRERPGDVTRRWPRTNFSVLRVRRDVLRRSSIGALFTQPLGSRRRRRAATRCSALDGTFAFFQNVYLQRLSGARHARPAGPRDDDQLPRQLQLRAPTATACRSIARSSATTSIPKSDSCRARSSAATSGRCGSARARAATRRFASTSTRRSLNYTTNNQNQLESRTMTSAARVDLQNSDVFQIDLLPRLRVAAAAVPAGVRRSRCRSGRYAISACRGLPGRPGSSIGSPAPLAVDVGEFYDGTRQTASVNARLGITRQLGIEPNISLNWIDAGRRPAPSVRATGARDHVHHDAPDVRRRAGPVRLDQPLARRPTCGSAGNTSRAASCSWSTPTARHVGHARPVRAAEPWRGREVQQALPVLTAGGEPGLCKKRQPAQPPHAYIHRCPGSQWAAATSTTR